MQNVIIHISQSLLNILCRYETNKKHIFSSLSLILNKNAIKVIKPKMGTLVHILQPQEPLTQNLPKTWSTSCIFNYWTSIQTKCQLSDSICRIDICFPMFTKKYLFLFFRNVRNGIDSVSSSSERRWRRRHEQLVSKESLRKFRVSEEWRKYGREVFRNFRRRK